jgi:hypothetical protein
MSHAMLCDANDAADVGGPIYLGRIRAGERHWLIVWRRHGPCD